ncbi:leucine-rich repeat-containing protein [Moumouvirus maliensis]|nr:leucine-rich repeat-containing protein [Moumouvirus maliensis]
MRAKSHRYPDNNDIYTDTTYYDKEESYFDLGYQRLKIINIDFYPEFKYLKKLFINNNKLKNLPDSKYLPHLKELVCSNNELTQIPLYPKLIYLDISHNKIIDCSHYNNSNINYFDCSFNSGFKLNFNIPVCKQLYIDNTGIENINLNYCPYLEILDCNNNLLKKIEGGNNLIEINIEDNKINCIPVWPKLLRLMANNNAINYLDTYPELVYLTINYNKLQQINDQPKLKKIIANNNNIVKIGKMPNLKFIDLSYNKIKLLEISNNCKYAYLQFNDLQKINISDTNIFSKLHELQIDFSTYSKIYNLCQNYISSINIQVSGEQLTLFLKKISNVFNDNIIKIIFNKLNSVNFPKRQQEIQYISFLIFNKYFSQSKYEKLNDVVNIKEFIILYEIILNAYYHNMIITLYFNGYY